MLDDKILFGYTGLFNSPNEIIRAAEKVSDAGYKKYDVNTPYPLHGMNSAMKLPPSKLGYAALIFGLSGMLAALAIMYWVAVIDYPLIIGGKPFFAFPAFVPVIFEVTVLSASIATVLTMISIFFKFPNISHPLHDTDYMKAVSSDKYGICIQADDAIFNETEVKNLLEKLNAHEIKPIYYDDNEIKHKNTVFEPRFLILLLFVALITAGATYFAMNKLLYAVPFNWMETQEKLNVQESSVFFSDGFGMRNPVDGTVSRGNLPYQFNGNPEAASTYLKNPLFPDDKNISIGKAKYDTYCSPCHGYFGEGNSRMRGQFPNPPTLHSEKVRNWKDGSIYHVIVDGQNIMSSYASQLTYQERWAVVLYIRVLQRSLNAMESDLE